jgi:hypothetical protein
MTRQPEDTLVDYVVRQTICWPDGKRKKSPNVEERRDRRRQLVLALVDKYNDYIGVCSLSLAPSRLQLISCNNQVVNYNCCS